MCVGLAGCGETISAQKTFDDPHVRDMRRTSTQDAQKSQTSHSPNPGAPKRALPKQGRSTRRGEAYPLGYVEGLNGARTLLANYFSMLLAAP